MTIHIACNIDDAYVQHNVVMLVSLFENNRDEDFHIHIMASELSEKSRDIIARHVDAYGNQVSFHIVGNRYESLSQANPEGYVSNATYYRCFMPSILPESIDKVIYLDSDIIVRGSVRDFWNINIPNNSVGVVEDMSSAVESNYSRLCYPSSYSYFNAGVLLVNLKYWRDNNVEESISTYISTYPERLLLNDQDALNACLHESKTFIPYRWNMQDGFYRKKRRMPESSLRKVDSEIPNAVIIHYTSAKKPWHDKCVHPLKPVYFEYLDKTDYKGWRPKHKLINVINRYIFPVEGLLGLKNTYRRIPR